MNKKASKRTIKRAVKSPAKTTPEKSKVENLDEKKVKPKSKMGRPRIVIDWDQFEKLCHLQCTKDEICDFLEVSDSTLSRAVKKKYGSTFEESYKKKSSPGKISLRRAQFQAAEGGNVTMQIWLGKQVLGQRDKTSADTSSKGKILEAIQKMVEE